MIIESCPISSLLEFIFVTKLRPQGAFPTIPPHLSTGFDVVWLSHLEAMADSNEYRKRTKEHKPSDAIYLLHYTRRSALSVGKGSFNELLGQLPFHGAFEAYLRALVFLLLRLRRRTRFFRHFALIVNN